MWNGPEYPVEPAKFASRAEAGSLLSSLLAPYAGQPDTTVIAIPRGGVPVAMELASILRLPLTLLVVEKIRIPVHEVWQSIRSIGAVAAGVAPVLASRKIEALHIPPHDVERAIGIARNDQVHKTEIYRSVCPPANLRGQRLVVVDDAVDSGATMEAAIRSLRLHAPAMIVIAAPVGSTDAIQQLSALADRVVIPIQAAEGAAVHECYAHFPPIDDTEVYTLFEGFLHQTPPARVVGR